MGFLTSSWLIDSLILLGTIFGTIFIFFQRRYQHWKKKGIPEVSEAKFPFGNFAGLASRSMIPIMDDLFKLAKKDQKLFGAYMFARPIIFAKDPDLIKDILVKEFSTFHDRGFEVDTKIDPLAQHLFLLNGQEWRNLRIKLTPTFTSGKMKMMFPTMFEVGHNMAAVFDKLADELEVEIKDILSRYTIDVIASVAFGLNANSLENPNCEFRRFGREAFNPSRYQAIINLLIITVPKLQKILRVRMVPKNQNDFFMKTVNDVIEERTKHNIKRNDFFQLLIQLKTLGYVPDADNPNKEDDAKNAKLFTVEQIAAQAFLFFFAGFETTSTTIQFALYELALNPDLQKAVQEEIDKVTKNHSSEVTYDSLYEMDLLDRIVSETLRKYPAAAILTRESLADYKVPDSDYVVEKGTPVWFPIYSLHHDPDVYPNPEKFDPDRFLPEEKEKRHQYSYLPFGEGPRSCIGNRFALMQVKAGLIIILSKYNLAPCAKTVIPLVFDPRTNLQTPKDGMFLTITQRQLK